MKTKKIILLIIFLLTLQHTTNAQDIRYFYPFKGFHIGFTGQAEYISKSTFIPVYGPDPAPKGVMTYGWETGIELSYHFANFFGISIGLYNVGTEMAYDCRNYISIAPDFKGGYQEINDYWPPLDLTMSELGNILPIKLEFHYPLCRFLFFSTEVGIKIKGIYHRIAFGKNSISSYSRSSHWMTFPPYTPDGEVIEEEVYSDWGYRELSKIRCDLLLGIGLYYKLPYGDLLRFSVGANLAFSPDIEGYYWYPITDCYGTFTTKNDFIYTQLSYIHTFNWQKAKRYVKKNDYSFSSKKERRKKIVEMLNVW